MSILLILPPKTLAVAVAWTPPLGGGAIVTNGV